MNRWGAGVLTKEFAEPEQAEEALKHGKVAALFYATWCHYCRAFKPAFESKAGEMRKRGYEAVGAVIDGDSNPLWDRYSIEIVPTVIFFENGKVVKRLDGKPGMGLGARDLEDALSELG